MESFKVFFLTFPLLLLASVSFAAGPQISGQLVDSVGNPLQAIITATTAITQQDGTAIIQTYTASTDQNGRYVLSLPQTGVYNLSYKFTRLLNIDNFAFNFNRLDLTLTSELYNPVQLIPVGNNRLRILINVTGVIDFDFPFPVEPQKILVSGNEISKLACSELGENNWCYGLDKRLRLKLRVLESQPIIGISISSVKSGLWSDPTVWSANRVPGQGDAVSIGQGHVVDYDVLSFTEIGNVTVMGSFKFVRAKSTQLDVGNIIVMQGGYFEAGIFSNPIPSGVQTSIRFVVKNESQFVGGPLFQPTDTGLWVMSGGRAELHGAPVTSWTRLAANVNPGSTTITVDNDANWKAGDKIVITTTSQFWNQTEENEILSVNGKTLTLKNPVMYQHDGIAPAQAEVALLTRNVLITSKYGEGRRSHTMYMYNSSGSLSYAEFSKLGPTNILGRYPVHFHLMGSTSAGMFAKGISMHDSGNRWVSIHSSNKILMEDSVGYNSSGHGYFFEVGNEVDNTLNRNIGITTYPGNLTEADQIWHSVFWIQNGANTITNNIAVGSVTPYAGRYGSNGFSVGEPPEIGPGIQIVKFDGNEAHANAMGLTFGWYIPGGTLSNLKIWRNGIGIQAGGSNFEVTKSLLFGNWFYAYGPHTQNETLRDSVILGDLPDKFAFPVDPHSGKPQGYCANWAVSFYDGDKFRQKLINVTFKDFRPCNGVALQSYTQSSRPQVDAINWTVSDTAIGFWGGFDINTTMRVYNYSGVDAAILGKDFELFPQEHIPTDRVCFSVSSIIYGTACKFK